MTPRERTMQRLEAIAKRRCVPLSYVMSDMRHCIYARARWEMFSMLRDDGWTLQRIANLFNRDHTTVLHGIRAHRAGVGIRDRRMKTERWAA